MNAHTNPTAESSCRCGHPYRQHSARFCADKNCGCLYFAEVKSFDELILVDAGLCENENCFYIAPIHEFVDNAVAFITKREPGRGLKCPRCGGNEISEGEMEKPDGRNHTQPLTS